MNLHVALQELHMVADRERGVALELSLVKLLHDAGGAGIQIIGMSATMAGPSSDDPHHLRHCCSNVIS